VLPFAIGFPERNEDLIYRKIRSFISRAARFVITTTFPGDEVPDYNRALAQIEQFTVAKINRLLAFFSKQTGKTIEIDEEE
jgi:hypothetical protein